MSAIWDKGDGAVSGLHIKTTATGRQSFFLYYRTRAGVQRRPKIGSIPEVSLGEARKRARKLLARVAVGEDPKGQWNVEKAEATVQELFELTWEAHWAKDRFSESGWAREVRRNYDNHIAPTFRHNKLSDVTAKRVREWHAGFSSSPIAGNRSLEVLSKMFNFAEEQELRPQNTNPCSLVAAFKEKKRKRFATLQEIEAVGRILAREALISPRAVAFLYLLIYSGSRPRAIERATWQQLERTEINGQPFGVLTFHGKSSEETGEDETVVLPPPAMRIIDQLSKDSNTITGVKMPRALWAKVREEAGCPDLWARDWRRTFATVGMSGGLGMDTISEVLNHRSTQTTKVYARLMQDARIRVTAAIAERMESLLSPEQTKLAG